MTDQPMFLPCPACPDGSLWTRDGPAGVCPVCKGKAYVIPGQTEDDMPDDERERFSGDTLVMLVTLLGYLHWILSL